jgi:hypothetical protein
MYSVPVSSIQHVIVAYEAVCYDAPLVPQVWSIINQWWHTVMVVLPWKHWAKLFVEWVREVKEAKSRDCKWQGKV